MVSFIIECNLILQHLAYMEHIARRTNIHTDEKKKERKEKKGEGVLRVRKNKEKKIAKLQNHCYI